RLEPLLSAAGPPATDGLPPSQQHVVDGIAARWGRLEADEVPPVVQLVGPDVQTKRLVAARAAAGLGRSLYSLPAESLPSTAADLEDLARLWHRESLLTAVALYLAAQFSLTPPASQRGSREALAGPADGTDGLRRRLWDDCLLTTRPRMDALAQRVEPKATWDDIVLPEPELALLHRIANQLRHRM